MRHIFTLLCLCLCTALFSQKIALIEPRAGEGSTEITSMEKAMVRGELRKAIVNHTGFEAFTRVDIDQLMKEQDFQRTGNVSQAEIHRMGEMSGADYICISTLNKSDNEFYLEAYLINVETGAISNPASQYGELLNGKLANMLPVCQALAQELLGTTTPVAQPVITPQETKKPKEEEPVPEKKKETIVAGNIGDVVRFDDGTRGVVFHKANGKSLCVALNEITAKWDNINSDRKCKDLALPNLEGDRYCIIGAGIQNTQQIISELGAQATAAQWCVSQGEGWYLPSDGELYTLLMSAKNINNALRAAGGQPLRDEWYWSSTENDKDEAINISASGRVSSESKVEILPVRAIKMF